MSRSKEEELDFKKESFNFKMEKMNEDRYTKIMERLTSLEVRFDNITTMLKDFIDSAKIQYLSKTEFERWKADEFSSVKIQTDEVGKIKWITIAAVVGTLLSMIFALFQIKI